MKVNNPNIAINKIQTIKRLCNHMELSNYYRNELYKIVGVPTKYLGNESK